MGVELLTGGQDMRRLQLLEALGTKLELPCVAAGDVHMHRRSRRALQDVLTAIRIGQPLHSAGYALHPNGERSLRSLRRLSELYRHRCWRRHCILPNAAPSSSMSCAMSIRKKSCPREKRPPAICARSRCAAAPIDGREARLPPCWRTSSMNCG